MAKEQLTLAWEDEAYNIGVYRNGKLVYGGEHSVVDVLKALKFNVKELETGFASRDDTWPENESELADKQKIVARYEAAKEELARIGLH